MNVFCNVLVDKFPKCSFKKAFVIMDYGNKNISIGSCVSVCSSRYEAYGKFGEHERCVKVASGVTESNSNFLSALQTSQVLHFLMNAQLIHEPIVL